MEITANALQTVNTNQNIIFTDTAVPGNCSIIHRSGSGLVTLKGISNTQPRARFKISFSGNIAIPTGGAVGAISLAVAADGEAIPVTTMTVTPAATENFFNVSTVTLEDVPAYCCEKIAIKNINSQAIEIQNANLIIERVA